MSDKPKLRALEAIPFQSSGEQLVCLRDPTGVSRKTVVLPPRAFFIAAQLDGKHTLREIQEEYVQRFGDLVFMEKIEELVGQLDEALLLEGARFEAQRRAVIEEFARLPRRKAVCPGNGYPAQPQAIQKMIHGFFTAAGGPGEVDPARREAGVVAIAAPHIDLRRGGVTYAYAWKELVERCAAETFIILGIAHQPGRRLYVLTDKDFETPLGTVACDKECARDLMRRAGLTRDEDELLHRGEHSIELQALWLRQLFGAKRPARIVPVLCGGIFETVGERADPLTVQPVARFVTALREILTEQEGRVAVIASVDLSHVGKRFGDAGRLSSDLLLDVEAQDRALLRHAEAMDARGFFDCNRRDGDRRHVCGFSALYTLLAALPARRGRLLHYDQAPDRESESVVSFAAMAFDA